MIYIKESTPKKISGSTSLFLELPYNQVSIDIIKSSGLAVWHKKEKIWEVPNTSLTYLLDNLTYVDDITLDILNQSEKEINQELTVNYKIKPFKHQEEAIKWGLSHDKWLLLDSPGLGKTASIIHLAEELKAQRGLEHCLIICGIATLRANWEKEIKLHSNESFVTIGKKITSRGNVVWTTVKERAEQLKNKIDEFFVILNIESIREDCVIDAINKSVNKFDMVAFDECHKANGTESIQSKNLLSMIDSTYKVGMTGTLLTNSPMSAFIPLKWIGVEHSTLTNYKAQYCEFGGFGGHQIVGYKNIDLLKDELEDCSLRRTKDLLDLPPKNVFNEYVEMNDRHRKFYDDVVAGVKEECDKIKLNTNSILALTTRLRQATSCPSILTSSDIVSSKLERCIDLVEDIVSQGDKVVVMSTFKEPIYQLKELLKNHKPLVCTGDEKEQTVSDNIDKFQKEDKYKVILCTTAKMGTGVTLNSARYLIMLDEPWTYALWLQATDRIHRVNNTSPVFIYNLICEDTIDEIVAKIIDRKKALADYMIDDIDESETINTLRKFIVDL